MLPIDNATEAIAITVALAIAFGCGLAVKKHDAPALRADRRARAVAKARGRHGLQPDTEQPDTTGTTTGEPDTIELPIVDSGDLTGRQRFANLHLDPAANMRAQQRVMRHATSEIRVLSHEILTAAGVPEIFNAVYGGQADDDAIPLFHETAAALAPPLPTLVGQPPRPGANVAAVIHQAALKQLAVTR